MIKEFSVKLKPSNSNARYAFIICMAIAFLLVMLSQIITLYQGIVALLGMIFLVAALTIYTKYQTVIYYYDIEIDSAGRALFIVRSHVSNRTGGKNSTLCRIDLADIVSIKKESRAERASHKTPYGYRKYNYFPTLVPKDSYRITTENEYEKAEINVEISDELAVLLKEYSVEAKEMYKNN